MTSVQWVYMQFPDNIFTSLHVRRLFPFDFTKHCRFSPGTPVLSSSNPNCPSQIFLDLKNSLELCISKLIVIQQLSLPVLFLGMATKQKFVFVFICCLLLISMAESSRLSRCLSACNKGTKAIQAFCRTVPLPQIRAICWGYQFAGPTACRGFCYWYFDQYGD